VLPKLGDLPVWVFSVSPATIFSPWDTNMSPAKSTVEFVFAQTSPSTGAASIAGSTVVSLWSFERILSHLGQSWPHLRGDGGGCWGFPEIDLWLPRGQNLGVFGRPVS